LHTHVFIEFAPFTYIHVLKSYKFTFCTKVFIEFGTFTYIQVLICKPHADKGHRKRCYLLYQTLIVDFL